ncbi:hypothetical protein AHAS_Ahas20G0092900 [Arachis hypogaea]
MADPPQRITLKEAGAPDLDLQPLQILYLALDPNFELKSGTINLLPKHNELHGEDPLKHLKDFQKTDKLQREISCIVQRDGETLYEYWERFKKLLEACPHHRIDELVLISYFCQGMHHQDKLLLDAVSGGHHLILAHLPQNNLPFTSPLLAPLSL